MDSPHFDDILAQACQKSASDVHLKVGIVPVVRRHGKMRPLSNKWKPLQAADLARFANELMPNETERNRFEHFKEIDLGYGVRGVGRFRVNIFQQRGSIRIVARVISDHVPTVDELNLPPILNKIAAHERGLVLVTGVTGSGKSTTLAAMIDEINRTKNKHIITIEDPIEFLIRDHKSLISQREIGLDTTTFATALRAALRQDPDVILIGEMRDKETIETALVAAETGHLVLSTLHTLNAQESVNRILSVFEPHQQSQIRRQLASTLRGVISQRLATRSDGTGVLPAVEILVNNARVREMISEPSKTRMITHAIETSAADTGMISFDQSLLELVFAEKVSLKEAMKLSDNPDDFLLRYRGVSPNLDKSGSSPKPPKKKEDLPSFQEFDLEDSEETRVANIRKSLKKRR